jgi:hypothetical protein
MNSQAIQTSASLSNAPAGIEIVRQPEHIEVDRFLAQGWLCVCDMVCISREIDDDVVDAPS